MNERISALLCIALVSFVPLKGEPRAPHHSLSFASARGGLNVYYDGKLRLEGGRPRIQTQSPSKFEGQEHDGRFTFRSPGGSLQALVRTSHDSSVLTFFLFCKGRRPGREFAGFFFDRMPGFRQGVCFWRYAPWKSWTKPVRVNDIGGVQEDDVQFMYWKYSDGLYGAAVPLSGNSYRTTLGQDERHFGSKSVNLFDGLERDSIPQMAVGFGPDPFRLIARLYEEALSAMGKKEDLRQSKKFPPILEDMGWCTWNASDNGKNLNEAFLLNAAKSFSDAHFPLGWFLVDDGWIDQTDGMLNSFEPDRKRFPEGFKGLIDTLKMRYHLKNVGVWHALNGHWRGINPNSRLATKYGDEFIDWVEQADLGAGNVGWKRCYFLSPSAESLGAFYEAFHRRLRDQGFSFVKVDNQLIVERIAVGNFPLWDGAESYHAALNASVARTFDNTLINCMDMTADAYLNFGTTSVARAVEDYFPYKEGESYDLQRGNAAAHVLQAVYNSLYFSQMVFPDFDMFQSHNPNALFHAVARALNCGPIYITDNIGEQRFDILTPLVYADGKLVHSEAPLLPTEDCLFQIQDAKPFKAFSTTRGIGLLGIWNCADAEQVKGVFRPSDVHSLPGDQFAVYDYFNKRLSFARKAEAIPVVLRRLECRLYYIIPLQNGNAAIGLVNKYNAPATILGAHCTSRSMDATVYEDGEFAAVTSSAPQCVSVDGTDLSFQYHDRLLL
ncbi:MAG TPA: Sip1-related alpha-galactosidase, partial [Bacteroidota bacterium]|nr:Sip1-related alpha-galactosidase [Bacteroidota bacterium]